MTKVATIPPEAAAPTGPADVVAAAIRACQEALIAHPDDQTALLMLGELALQRGELKQAREIIGAELAVRPTSALAHFMLARIGHLTGDFAAAEDGYRRTIRFWPEFALAYGNLTLLLFDAGQYREALPVARRAAELDPHLHDIHLTIGRILIASLNWQAAEAPLKRGLEIDPDCVEAHNQLGHVYYFLGQHENAFASYRRAIDLEPEDAVSWAGLGSVAQARGNFNEAIACLSRAIEINPNLGEAHCTLAMCRRSKQGEARLATMANILADDALPTSNRISAAFGLGKTLDDEGRYDEAFSYYRQANEMVQESTEGSDRAFDLRRLRQKVETISNIFTPEFFAEHAGTGHASRRPVFIVGLYRSGTTLTEQILASHSKVHGAGELQEIGVLRNRLLPQFMRKEAMPNNAIQELAEQYLRKIESTEKASLRGVDKHPDNLFSLGLIALLFPHAKIIYCHRDPRDNVLSCYFQRFSEYMSFSTDLANCAMHYLETERMAAHWDRVLPVPVLHMQYESLVSDLEGQARRMIDFLGLDWESSCLNYFDTERAVITPSAWAVRQPIFTSSSGRWKNYAHYLEPLFQVLSGIGLDPAKTSLMDFAEVQAALARG